MTEAEAMAEIERLDELIAKTQRRIGEHVEELRRGNEYLERLIEAMGEARGLVKRA